MNPTTRSSNPRVHSAAEFIPLSVPEVRGNEWKYVKECLDTSWVSTVGKYVGQFEQVVADAVGARYGIAAVNGTAALHTALIVCGVQPDDEVLVSTLSFIAPANAVRYVGAWPVFIDAEPRYWQMDPDMVAAFLQHQCVRRDGAVYNKVTGRRITAIIPVHILGHPVEMRPVIEVSREYGLTVIEDATECLGTLYEQTPVGHLGDLACFSFNGNKIITTGGGGMIVTDNEAWARKAKYLTTQAKDDEIEYIHGAIGYNYRLTNIQAAMGVAQMEQLDAYVNRKREIASMYTDALQDIPGITVMPEAPWARSTYWMYTVLVDAQKFGRDSRQLLKHLEARKIQTRPLWQPLHCSPAHKQSGAASCPVAERLNKEALSLPCSVGLTPAMQSRVIDEIRAIATTYAP